MKTALALTLLLTFVCATPKGRAISITTKSPPPADRKFIVITDLEPDDRLALMMLAANVQPSQVLLVGTTLLDSGRKAALTKRLLQQIGLGSVKVVTGSDGEAQDYPRIASSAAAREYRNEGVGILSAADLKKVSAAPRGGQRVMRLSPNLLSTAITEALRPYRYTGNVEIILLATPTDFAVAMNGADMGPAISKIHVMGGWASTPDATFSTYNWNMDPVAAAKLLEMSRYGHIETILYSSHLIEGTFAGGSVSPAIEDGRRMINAMKAAAATNPAFKDFFTAVKSWNSHVIDQIPALKPVIGAHIDDQFTPADPLVIAGLFDPAVIVEKRRLAVEFENVNKPDPARGYPMRIHGSNESSLFSVEEVNPSAFYKFGLEAVTKLEHICETMLGNASKDRREANL